MRSPAALLLVTPLLACFADGGSTTVVTSDTTGAVASTGPGTEAGTEAGTAAPTTTGTSGATTSSDATSEGPGSGTSTGAVGNCQLAPECEAGAVESGEQCDSCGVMRRTCQADCTWTPMACEQDLGTCEYWVLPSNEFVWQRVPVDPAAPFAPKETVLAAIALAPQQQIVVFTATSYHVLSTVTRTWVLSAPREMVFPEIAGLPLYHVSGIAKDPPDTIITVVAGNQAYAYTYHGDGATVEFVAKLPCCGEDWTGPDAPPTPYVVRDGWGRLGNPEGWIPGDVVALCSLQPEDPFYGYSVAIGNGFVYPQDIGYCFDFYPPIPYDQFTPFTYPGRPANELVGGAAWVDGLWIFRGE